MNKIDAVEVVRKIRDKNYDETKDMSPKEKLEYIREKARQLESSAPAGTLTS